MSLEKRPKAAMEWSDPHDVMSCREILYEDPFQFKKGSPDRGEVWSKIARALNSCTELKFNVKQRSVRERFTLLQIKYKETTGKMRPAVEHQGKCQN